MRGQGRRSAESERSMSMRTMTSTGWSHDAVWSLRGTKDVCPRARAGEGVLGVEVEGMSMGGGDVTGRVSVEADVVEGGPVSVREGVEDVDGVRVKEVDGEGCGRIGVEEEAREVEFEKRWVCVCLQSEV